jgi:hypothetical protein
VAAEKKISGGSQYLVAKIMADGNVAAAISGSNIQSSQRYRVTL